MPLEHKTVYRGRHLGGAIANEQWFDEAGKPHSLDDKPSFISYKLSGVMGLQMWHKHGKLHRENGPAVFYPQDDITEYWLDGHLIFSKKTEK